MLRDIKIIEDEMKNKISMELQNPITQQGFEIICKHILELQKDKGRLTDQLTEAMEIIRELAKYEMQGAGCVYWKNKAEAFLKEKKGEEKPEQPKTPKKKTVEACKICDNNCGYCKYNCNCYTEVEV